MSKLRDRVAKGFLLPPPKRKLPSRIARTSNPHAVTYQIGENEKIVFEHPLIPQGFKIACAPSDDEFMAVIKINDQPVRMKSKSSFFTIQFIGCVIRLESSKQCTYIGCTNFELGFIKSVEVTITSGGTANKFFIEGFEGG